ncbi:MAG: hypothetical protein M1817_000251 [Caeruleum heppii]|nr:MAG: hypothetical protein M1817_000251 [Caeruleum heppii]
MRFRPRILLGNHNLNDPHELFSIRRVLHTPSGLILICFSIFYLLAFRYLSHANYRDPTSYFFDPTRAYERRYSNERIKQADAFIEAAHRVSPPASEVTRTEPPSLCLGIATVARRGGEQYVRQTVGSLLAGLTEVERRAIYLDLLIAHTDPHTHPIAREKWIETLPDKVLQYDPTNAADLARLRTWKEGSWYRNKTIYDYTYLLRDCLATGARYIAMIEDDTLAVEGWLPRAMSAVEEVDTRMRLHRSDQNFAWIYLRLFFEEDLLGWNSENWPSYLFWSFVIWATVTGALLLLLTHAPSRWLRSHLPPTAIITTATICIPLCIILFFLGGRHSIWPLAAGVHEMNRYGCCSQGYIFPAAIVPRFLELTDYDRTDWLVDMMVETIADAQGWARWVVVPALLQHIGTTSSKGYGFDDSARKLWNFGFELYEQDVRRTV